MPYVAAPRRFLKVIVFLLILGGMVCGAQAQDAASLQAGGGLSAISWEYSSVCDLMKPQPVVENTSPNFRNKND